MTTEQDEDGLIPPFDPDATTVVEETGPEDPWAIPVDEPEGEAEPEEDVPDFEPPEGREPEEFPEELRDDYMALVQGRRLHDEAHWLGHRYVIQNLLIGEILDVGLIHKRFQQTLGDVKAYQTAILAACIVSVDGEPLPVPPSAQAGPSEIDPVLLDRFHHLRTWLPFTVDAIYERYMLLDERIQKVLEAMGNRSG